MSNGAGKFSPFPKMSFRTSLHATKSLTTAVIDAIQTDYGFISNNEFILPKTVCFLTVHWCQSWGGAKCMVPPNPVIGGGAVPPPSSAAYGSNAQRMCERPLTPCTLYLPRKSMEQGRRAIWPRTTVTLTIGTSNVGSSPTPATTAAPPTHTHTHTRRYSLAHADFSHHSPFYCATLC